MKHFLLLFISFSTLLLSCSKQSSNEDFNDKLKNSSSSKAVTNASSSDTIATVSNPNNPYETVGINHNQGLREIVPKYETGNLEPSEQNVNDNTVQFMKTHGYGEQPYQDIHLWTIQNGVYNYNTPPTTDSVTVKMFKAGYISTTAENYTFRLSNLCKSIASTTSPTQAMYNSFANQVITYENQIMADNTLSANDKSMLLSAHAVARYSLDYWFNYTNSSGLLTKSKMSPMVVTKKSWFDWKDAVGDDVAGAVGGAIGGAIVGSWFGGIGSGPGAVVGGVGTAVGNSVANSVKQIWNHYFKK